MGAAHVGDSSGGGHKSGRREERGMPREREYISAASADILIFPRKCLDTVPRGKPVFSETKLWLTPMRRIISCKFSIRLYYA